jgi:UDP-N-acetylglucosamine--N-acetylmuramyl-(pentapeptide) pyrophosphoryl-undecaprenol N-acetylglucosamine transferase
VGDALRRAASDVEVVYVGTSRGLEARIVPERGDTLLRMNILPLRGGGASGFVRGAYRAAASIPEARRLIRLHRPSAVLSVGGYAAGPISLAARMLGVPLAILEPNSTLGFANRLLSPLAKRAYTAFPEVERFFRQSVVLRAGVPLRSAFVRAQVREHGTSMRVLVLGGSLGAAALNQTVPQGLASASKRVAIEVVHQTGRGRDADVRALYAELGLTTAQVVPFIDDVAGALADADVVIARAGASSCAELCAVGRPSILVPYPFAADDHQFKNARSLERAGAAIAIRQKEATGDRIAAEVAALAADPARRAHMADAAGGLGKRDAASVIATDLLALARAFRSAA